MASTAAERPPGEHIETARQSIQTAQLLSERPANGQHWVPSGISKTARHDTRRHLEARDDLPNTRVHIATRGPALTSSPPCPLRAQPFADRVDQSLRAAGETLDEVDAEISEFRAHMRSAVVIYASQQDELRGSARAARARGARAGAPPRRAAASLR